MESTKKLEEAERWANLYTLARFVRDEYERTCVSHYGEEEGQSRYKEQFEELFAALLATTGINEEYARQEYESLYDEEQGDKEK